jgi:hypothetical protein
VVETPTGEIVATIRWWRPARSRSPMRTTAVRDRCHGGRCDPEHQRRRRSARSARSPRRSSPAPPRLGTPGWGPNWSNWRRWRRRTGGRCCWPRWSGRSPSAAGAWPTCAPSWTPAPARPRPRPAGDALVLELPMVPARSLADYAIDRSGAGAR